MPAFLFLLLIGIKVLRMIGNIKNIRPFLNCNVSTTFINLSSVNKISFTIADSLKTAETSVSRTSIYIETSTNFILIFYCYLYKYKNNPGLWETLKPPSTLGPTRLFQVNKFKNRRSPSGSISVFHQLDEIVSGKTPKYFGSQPLFYLVHKLGSKPLICIFAPNDRPEKCNENVNIAHANVKTTLHPPTMKIVFNNLLVFLWLAFYSRFCDSRYMFTIGKTMNSNPPLFVLMSSA